MFAGILLPTRIAAATAAAPAEFLAQLESDQAEARLAYTRKEVAAMDAYLSGLDLADVANAPLPDDPKASEKERFNRERSLNAKLKAARDAATKCAAIDKEAAQAHNVVDRQAFELDHIRQKRAVYYNAIDGLQAKATWATYVELKGAPTAKAARERRPIVGGIVSPPAQSSEPEPVHPKRP